VLFTATLEEPQFIHGDRPSSAPLLAGIAILASTISGIFLILQMTNEDIPPSLTVGVSGLLGVLFIGWAVYRLFAEHQTSIVFRLIFLVAALCFSIGLVSTMIALKHEALAIAPANYRALQALNGVLSPIGWLALIISNFRPLATRTIQWNKQASVRLGLFSIVLILLLLLLLTR
jgi:hypothetical protein